MLFRLFLFLFLQVGRTFTSTGFDKANLTTLDPYVWGSIQVSPLALFSPTPSSSRHVSNPAPQTLTPPPYVPNIPP